MENVVEKGEIARFEQFHFFHYVFLKRFLQRAKMSIYGAKGYLQTR